MSRSIYHCRRESNGTWSAAADWSQSTGLASQPRDVSISTTSNHVHFVGTSLTGAIWHRTVDRNDTQSPFGDVAAAAGSVGQFTASATATDADDLHVLAVTTQGVLWHTIRYGTGNWDPFGNVFLAAGNSGRLADVSCAFVGKDLHVVVVDAAGVLQHTVRTPDRNWVPWGNVTAETGATLKAAARVSSTAIGHDLHVCVATSHGHIGHTVRLPSGTWSKMGDVKSQCGQIGYVVDVDCAPTLGDLQLVCSDPSGSVQHTIRRADGFWRPFGNVNHETRLPSGSVLNIACHATNGVLHVVLVSDQTTYKGILEAAEIQTLLAEATREDIARQCATKTAFAGGAALIGGLLSGSPGAGAFGGAAAAAAVLVWDDDCRRSREQAAERLRERREMIDRINRNDREIERLREAMRTA